MALEGAKMTGPIDQGSITILGDGPMANLLAAAFPDARWVSFNEPKTIKPHNNSFVYHNTPQLRALFEDYGVLDQINVVEIANLCLSNVNKPSDRKFQPTVKPIDNEFKQAYRRQWGRVPGFCNQKTVEVIHNAQGLIEDIIKDRPRPQETEPAAIKDAFQIPLKYRDMNKNVFKKQGDIVFNTLPLPLTAMLCGMWGGEPVFRYNQFEGDFYVRGRYVEDEFSIYSQYKNAHIYVINGGFFRYSTYSHCKERIGEELCVWPNPLNTAGYYLYQSEAHLQMCADLARHGIHQLGRYAKWQPGYRVVDGLDEAMEITWE